NLLPLLARDFTVYALDLRGHGESVEASTNWSCDALADDVAAFAETLGLTGAVYAGHSIGGFTGMLTAIRHPGVFSALCLLATAPASAGRHTAKENGAIFFEKGRDADTMYEVMAHAYVRPIPAEVRHAAASTAIMSPSVHEAFFPNFADCAIALQR